MEYYCTRQRERWNVWAKELRAPDPTCLFLVWSVTDNVNLPCVRDGRGSLLLVAVASKRKEFHGLNKMLLVARDKCTSKKV